MARMTKSKRTQVKTALADILYNHNEEIKFSDEGKPSVLQLTQVLKSRYGLSVTRETIYRFLEAGVENYRQKAITVDNDNKIRDIKEAMRVQKMIWNSSDFSAADRTKAANAWRALHKQQMEYEKQLADAQIKIAEVTKPNYLIKFEPRNVSIKCPKCGHEWYDAENKVKKDKKQPFFKTDKKQKSFDSFGDKKDGSNGKNKI